MSIDILGAYYIPTCDGCRKELPDKFNYEDSKKALLDAGWHRVKQPSGEWYDYCPECWEEVGKDENN